MRFTDADYAACAEAFETLQQTKAHILALVEGGSGSDSGKMYLTDALRNVDEAIADLVGSFWNNECGVRQVEGNEANAMLRDPDFVVDVIKISYEEAAAQFPDCISRVRLAIKSIILCLEHLKLFVDIDVTSAEERTIEVAAEMSCLRHGIEWLEEIESRVLEAESLLNTTDTPSDEFNQLISQVELLWQE